MGIGKRCDGSYYIRCDWDDCGYKVNLEAKDFWQAKDEAKRLGWTVSKTPSGWKNFHTKFCEMCYFAPQIIVKRTPALPLTELVMSSYRSKAS